ncbi:hypothetical protein EJ04DRAFT_568755 [Polyplosphaeria fusca]|uniref:Yeast cell wall synthesis Kre9/Knh1-like N-terminal domain-containing protein n=1 Tax=Polyplosphaeria fusca TaxID=682080 RepID=A0A9P4QQN3_9PLEO|nr:hypothetical protein EJ04DRAFT_568755 [Polyplosphaeria fusca]
MFGKITALALWAGLAVAQLHAPVGNPDGNPITRPLNEIIPAGKPFQITWTPTTTNTVSILLLKGPSTNVVPIKTLAEGIANSGSLTFTPSTDLEASTDATGYGIQLIDDVTGQYQYSTQFGISNDNPVSSAASSLASAASSYGGGYGTPTSSVPSYETSSAPLYNTTIIASSYVTSHVASTGYPVHNSSIVLPTKSMSVPSSLKTSATGSNPSPPASTSAPSPPASTGAASSLRAGFGLVGALAAAMYVL